MRGLRLVDKWSAPSVIENPFDGPAPQIEFPTRGHFGKGKQIDLAAGWAFNYSRHPSICSCRKRATSSGFSSVSAAARPATQNENEGSAMPIVFLFCGRPKRARIGGKHSGAGGRPPFRTSSPLEHVICSSLPPGVVSSQPPPPYRGSQGYGASNTETVISEAMFANGKSEARGGRPHLAAVVHRHHDVCTKLWARGGGGGGRGVIDVVSRGRQMGVQVCCLQGCQKVGHSCVSKLSI